jgi:hypothetical protein
MAQGLGQRFHLRVFKEMNELLERTLVAAERVGGIEVRQALTADHTDFVVIQRIVIREWGPTGTAKKFSLQRLG